jgi:hypothetical protein
MEATGPGTSNNSNNNKNNSSNNNDYTNLGNSEDTEASSSRIDPLECYQHVFFNPIPTFWLFRQRSHWSVRFSSQAGTTVVSWREEDAKLVPSGYCQP